MINERNRYDKKDSLELGNSAEIFFYRISQNRGWSIKKSSDNENINEHWDFLIEKHGEKYRVEVKSMKRISRDDTDVQDEWVWIEFHGVRDYDLGWLFGGKSELIAFEQKDRFFIVKRESLILLAANVVDFSVSVQESKDAKYKLYQRSGRPDKMSLIESKKLKPILWDEWKKENN